MAVTSAITLMVNEDRVRMVLATVTMDSSYAAGGEVVTPGDLGLQRIDGAIIGNEFDATPEGFTGAWDQTNKKLLVFAKDGTTGAAQASGDLTALAFTCLFFGV